MDQTKTTGLSIVGTKNPSNPHQAAIKFDTALNLSTVLNL